MNPISGAEALDSQAHPTHHRKGDSVTAPAYLAAAAASDRPSEHHPDCICDEPACGIYTCEMCHRERPLTKAAIRWTTVRTR